MAEAFGIASGLVGLAGFAFQTSKSLYQLVESFKSSKRAIRGLRDELQSLNDILETLKGRAAELEDELDALKQPLFRCGRICQEFEDTLKSCTSHSSVDRTSFRDWAKLQYIGGDINKLRTTLAEYKATISIALGSATFRHVEVTSNVLDEFTQMIDETTSDLQDHLHEIYENLQLLNEASEGPLSSDLDSKAIKEEKQSTEQCLAICARASEYINGLQTGLLNNSASASSLPIDPAHEEDIEFQHAKKVSRAMFQDHQSQISTNTIIPGPRFITSAPVSKARIKSSSDISDETNLNDEKWQNVISSRWRKNECFNCGYASHYEDECYLKCGKCLMNDHTQRHCPKLIKHFSDEQWNTVIGHRWRKNECLNCGYASHYEDRCYLKCGRCLTGGHTQRNCRERISHANGDFTAEMTDLERLHGVNFARTDLSPANVPGDWTRQQDNAAYDAHTSRNPSSFNFPGAVANDRQPLPGSADFEYSESSSENNSVFSAPFSVPSTASLEPGKDGINLLLIQEFATLFHKDSILLSLILDGITKPWIGFETMLKNFRRFLIHFANQLKTEVLSDWHQNVSSFVRSSSTQITRALFAMVPIDKEQSINPQIASVKNRHTKRKVEYYLKSLYGGHHAFRSNGIIENFNNDQEESDEDSVLDEAGEVEPYEGSLQHLDQTKHLISESAAYQTLLCQLEEFIWPSLHSRLRGLLRRWSNPQNKNYSDVVRYSLRDLVAELQYVNPYDIIFDHGDETSRFVWYTSYYQHLVEDRTGERWDWWPLPRCLRPLGESETRLRWKCSCGEERWKEVPKTFTKRLQSIIKDIAMNTAGNPNIQPPPAAHVKPTIPRNTSSSSQSSNQKLRTDNRLQKDSSSSSPSVHHESMWLKANGPNMSLAQHRVLFLAKQGEDYKLAQIRVDDLGCDTFFDTLKKEYFRLRGALRGHFSVWRYSHCDFYKFEKFDDHEFTPITKDAFPDQTNTDYEYRPKPMDTIPPISKHEFTKRFYACHKPRPLLHIHHRCRKLGTHSSDVLHFLPKKKTELEEAGFKREEFWGIYAREIISLRWIILYNFFCVSPLLLFFVAWTLPRGHDTDLQSPSIPLSLMGSMLSLFWSIFLSSLQFGKSH